MPLAGTFGFSLSDLEALRDSDVPLLNVSRVQFDTPNHGRQGGDNFYEVRWLPLYALRIIPPMALVAAHLLHVLVPCTATCYHPCPPTPTLLPLLLLPGRVTWIPR